MTISNLNYPCRHIILFLIISQDFREYAPQSTVITTKIKLGVVSQTSTKIQLDVFVSVKFRVRFSLGLYFVFQDVRFILLSFPSDLIVNCGNAFLSFLLQDLFLDLDLQHGLLSLGVSHSLVIGDVLD